MTGIARGSRGRTLRLIVVIAVVYVAVTVLGRAGAAVLTFPLGPGLVVALGLVLGPVVAVGAATGYVAVDLLTGTFGPATAVGYVAQFVLVVTARRVWGAFGPLSTGHSPGDRTIRTLVEYVLVAVTTAVVAAATVSFGAVLLAETPFSAVVMSRLREYLLSTLLVGTPLLYVLSPVVDRTSVRRWTGGRAGRSAGDRWPVPTGVLVAAIGIAWCVAGYGIAFVFHDIGVTSEHLLINRLGRGIVAVLTVAGPDGLYLQLAVNGLLAAAYVTVVEGLFD
jgi:hypothetical protein